MVKYVRQLSPAEKLDIYKKVKGTCLYEGCWSLNCMITIMNEKAKDILDVLDCNMGYNCMEIYKDYSYGR